MTNTSNWKHALIFLMIASVLISISAGASGMAFKKEITQQTEINSESITGNPTCTLPLTVLTPQDNKTQSTLPADNQITCSTSDSAQADNTNLAAEREKNLATKPKDETQPTTDGPTTTSNESQGQKTQETGPQIEYGSDPNRKGKQRVPKDFIPEDGTTIPNTSICTDTDNGVFSMVTGTVIITQNGSTIARTDYCIQNPNASWSVTEHYCETLPTPMPATMLPPIKQPDGNMLIKFKGQIGAKYEVQATTNFINWTVLGQVTGDP